jgi:hypothetical protein
MKQFFPVSARVLVAVAAGAVLAGAVVAPRLGAQALERDLYVGVLSPSGAPATDLQINEFIVREDGTSREVLRVVPATDPLLIALVVDNSAAAEDDIPNLRDGLRAFETSLTVDHELAIITTADRPTIVIDYTSDRARIEKGIGAVFPRMGSGAYMMEALIEVARGISRRESARPVIVAISSEGPELSDQHERQVLEALKTSGAALHSVVLTVPGAQVLSENARVRSTVFDRGGRESGGRRDMVLTSQALPDFLRSLAAELSRQYKVTYARPGTLVPPETVTVGVTRAGHVARGTPARAPRGGA